MKIQIKPFIVPNFVIQETPPGRRQDGLVPSPSYPLAALDPDELSAMCDEFRAAVFVKAGKQDPKVKP